MTANPVYCWNTEEYKSKFNEAFKTPEEFLRVSVESFEVPLAIASIRPPVGVLHADGVRYISSITGWFDGKQLEEIAREGIDLMADLPQGARPPPGVSLWRGNEEETRYMKEVIIGKGVCAGHMREATKEEEKLANLHPTFLLFKRAGKYRDVINFKARLMVAAWGRRGISFNESTPLDRRPSISPGRWKNVFHMLEYLVRCGVPKNQIRLAKLDIAEAYKHIRIMKGVQLQQCFKVLGRTYISLRMQFGTAASASIWCRLMNMVDQAFHYFGLGTVSYFDDILVVMVSAAQACSALRLIRAILRCLGLKVNEEKSDKHGVTACEFLGVEIDLGRWAAKVMDKTVDKIVMRGRELMELLTRQIEKKGSKELVDEAGGKEHAPEESEDEVVAAELAFKDDMEVTTTSGDSVKKLAQKIAGGLNFAAGVIRCIKPIRSHFHWVASVGRIYDDVATMHYIRLTEALLKSHNWMKIIHKPYEYARMHDTKLASDSSDYAFGAIAEDADGNGYYIQERWDEIGEGYKDLHINEKELISHIMGVQLLGNVVAKEYVIMRSLIDNKSAESWVQKLFAKVTKKGGKVVQKRRLELLLNYALWQQNRGVIVEATYIKSELNIIPDAFSRWDTHQYIALNWIQEYKRRGKRCTRVRVEKGWVPEGR